MIDMVGLMDSQRFDVSKRRKNSSMNLSIQTGLSDDENTSSSSRSSSPLRTTPEGSWDSFAFVCNFTPEPSESGTDSAPSAPSTPPPPTPPKDNDNDETVVSFLTPRKKPILHYFSRPSSPVPSRPNSPLRPSSPINFGALNCFSNADAFSEHVDYLQAQRARELEGSADVKVHVHQVVATDIQAQLPWIVQKVVDPEALRVQRMREEPRGVVSCP
ncbi:hypothetical protein C8R45DRAFT_127020 [Mycena sanguinolenta]|nr:hypothetical protein C8R45DRAFT_127020 [Mycena sanguinolenta]